MGFLNVVKKVATFAGNVLTGNIGGAVGALLPAVGGIVGGVIQDKQQARNDEKNNAAQAAADKRNNEALAATEKKNAATLLSQDRKNNASQASAETFNNKALREAEQKTWDHYVSTTNYNRKSEENAWFRRIDDVNEYNDRLDKNWELDKQDTRETDQYNQMVTTKNRDYDVRDRENMFSDLRAAAVKGGFNPLAVLQITGGAGFGAGSVGPAFSQLTQLRARPDTHMIDPELAAEQRESRVYGADQYSPFRHSSTQAAAPSYTPAAYSYGGNTSRAINSAVSGQAGLDRRTAEAQLEVLRSTAAANRWDMTRPQVMPGGANTRPTGNTGVGRPPITGSRPGAVQKPILTTPSTVIGDDGLERANPVDPAEMEADLWDQARQGTLPGYLLEIYKRNTGYYQSQQRRAERMKNFPAYVPTPPRSTRETEPFLSVPLKNPIVGPFLERFN